MSDKLVDIGRISKLAFELDSRMKNKFEEEKERALDAESGLQTQVNEVEEMLGGKSFIYLTQAEYELLSEEEKSSEDVVYFITDAVDMSHHHENKDFLDSLNEDDYMQLGADITSLQNTKLDKSIYDDNVPALIEAKHSHDNKDFLDTLSADTYNELVAKVTSLENTKLDSSFESTINNLSNAMHSHDNADVLNGLTAEKFAAYDSDIAGLKSGKLDNTYENVINELDTAKHTHTNKAFLDELSSETFAAINASITSLENNKLNKTDYNTDMANKQDKTDNTLSTNNKTIVGAINELKGVQDDFSASLLELNNTKVDKNYVDEKLEVVDAISLNGYSIWVGTTEELENITKNENTLYFEINDEEEQNTQSVVQVDIVDGVLNLTNDMYQKTNMVTGTQIVFPEVSGFTEIHLYFDAETDMDLNFPECKWRVDPNIESGKSYEIVATYNTIQWLVNVIVYS